MNDIATEPDFHMSRILVVDDNPVNRKLLASILGKVGYEVVSAAGGAEALALVRQYSFDLILLDIIMPEVDGFSVCEILQQDRQTKHVPVIMVSSMDLSETKVRCFELGAVDYITKPFHTGEVLARIRSQLDIKRLTASLLKSNKRLQERQNIVDQDLQAAAAIQRALLPEDIPFSRQLRSQYTFRPCERIGGDIFNVFALGESSVGIYIVDVCGHGVPAAMIATLVSQAMSPFGHLVSTLSHENKVLQINNPLQVLEQLDKLFPIERFDRYFTISYMVINLRSGEFSSSSAGHPPVFLQRNTGVIEMLEAGGPIIGLGSFAPKRKQETGHIEPGDRLIFYSDGIIELENATGEMFGVERVKSLIEQQKSMPFDHYPQAVDQRLEEFTNGAVANDDISLLYLEYLG